MVVHPLRDMIDVTADHVTGSGLPSMPDLPITLPAKDANDGQHKAQGHANAWDYFANEKLPRISYLNGKQQKNNNGQHNKSYKRSANQFAPLTFLGGA